MSFLLDNREIELPAGRRLNAIEAARWAGVEIPHYCWHPALSVVGSCRMCLIEVGFRDVRTGKITMQRRLAPACATTVVDHMVLVTQSEKVARARAMVEEQLLLRHPIDCPICDKAGECVLQDYHFQYGQKERRADPRPFSSRCRDLGDVTLFVDRCVMCSRCVRMTAEISGTRELLVAGRGTHEEIDVVPGFPLNNKLSGNVVDLCPVGALADKDFLYKQRVWFMNRHAGVCTGCATGCSTWVEENQDRVYRIKPRENPALNRWWICNDGRYDYPHVHDPKRLTQLQGAGTLDALNEQLRGAGRLAGVVSPFVTVEEAYLLCRLLRDRDPDALLALGPVPVVGDDERFPSGFLISAEKCPNRRGVEAVLAHFAGRVASFDELLARLDADAIDGAWVSGGYKQAWITDATARRFERLKLLVVQDLFPSPLSEVADWVLPGAAFAERDGSYVNRFDRLQQVCWAIRPPLGVRPEGSVLWGLAGRSGLYNAEAVREELAREILYFSAAMGLVPDVGVDLRGNLLAEHGTSENSVVS
ncbi:MAG: 2Fe-2S iron-sulfur cluster-binding protein [Thermoguttaceae bacterium]